MIDINENPNVLTNVQQSGDSLENIKLKRLLVQKLLAKTQSMPTSISPGEPPAKAWQPVIQALLGGLKDRKLAGQEQDAQNRQQQTLSQAFGPVKTNTGDEFGMTYEQSRPRTPEETIGVLSQNPDTMKYGMQMSLENMKNKSAEANRQADMRTQHENRQDDLRLAATLRNDNPKAPKDFRYDTQGGLQVIPGSATDIKNKKTQVGADSSLKMNVHNIDRTLGLIDELENHPGLSGNFGVSGMLPNMPSGDSADFKAKQDTLLNQLGIQTLNDMRASSKTGGAVGNVTEKEWPILQQNIQSLSKSQSEDQARNNLRQMKDHLNFIKQNAIDTYKETYGAPGNNSSSPDDEYEKLKRKHLGQ